MLSLMDSRTTVTSKSNVSPAIEKILFLQTGVTTLSVGIVADSIVAKQVTNSIYAFM